MSKLTYSAVVREQNCWDARTGISPIECSCGHKHKTPAAANACLDRLLNYQCDHGTRSGTLCSLCRGYAQYKMHSARWHRGHVEDSEGNFIVMGFDESV